MSTHNRLFHLACKAAKEQNYSASLKSSQIEKELSAALKSIEGCHDKVYNRFYKSADMPRACEWLLDNLYLVRREAKLAQADFSREKALPASGLKARIICLCEAFLDACACNVTESACLEYLRGYQSVFVLPRKELYLFPAALKAALVFRIEELCSELLRSSSPDELSALISRAFESLRVVAGLNMRLILESVDKTEELLRSDPAGIYPLMDEESRSLYRERLSQLAKKKGMEEHRYAKQLISIAETSGEKKHIGSLMFPNEENRKGALYISTNILITLFLSILCGFLSKSLAAALLLLLPISELTKSLVDYIILLAVPPRRLPRLELKDGVPEEGKSICVISALLTESGFEKLCTSLEEAAISNRSCGKNLMYGILADLPESKTEVCENDAKILGSATKMIESLNSHYGGGFYLFCRKRTLDKTRGVYCGYERKRGAVLALAKLLLGEGSELSIAAGDEKRLENTKFIITLDSDTKPFPEALNELIGTALHPLNRAVIDTEAGIVTHGHGIISPRMNTQLASAAATDFSRIFASQGGNDAYSFLSGELYMDLFGAGGFSGKGIIDAKALSVCSEAHLPEAKVLSHDALEGAYLHAGYLSSTQFSDSFPSSPIAYYRRLHRWTRGDWQNSPWIFSSRAKLPDIERWKLFDSLRRSLVAPAEFIAIALGLFFPVKALALAAITALLALGVRLLIALAETASKGREDIKLKLHSTLRHGLSLAFVQTLFRLWLLPYEAWICASAAVCALWRMLISRKKLLEWETSAQTESRKNTPGAFFLNMWFSIVAGILLLLFSPNFIGVLIGLFWLAAPAAAYALSLPAKSKSGPDEKDAAYLKELCSGIWNYFDKFCSAEDNFLPPDNFQEQPPVGLAHRTSPTNIGLALVSSLCAMRLELCSTARALEFIENMLLSLEKMPKSHGHFYNWYDTRSLRPLEPRYISTVDSGNLFACLTVLKNELLRLGQDVLALRVCTLMASMDFAPLYDEKADLFFIGIPPDGELPSSGHYDLMASEAQLTSYLALAKGDVPKKHWQHLSRAMLRYRHYQGMASWSGTMFEYLMPLLFLPLEKNSLMYETAKYCLLVQKRRQSPNGLWGISECAFFSLDGALNYRYKACGCKHLALKRGQELDLVISPYSSFLALSVEPSAALKNLRRLDKAGARGRFGFIEAIDFSPSRCRSAQGERVACYMSHHLGMSMLAATNYLCGNYVQRLFMADPSMAAYRGLIEEKLPLSAVICNSKDIEMPKTEKIHSSSWTLRGEDFDFENPECAVLSNGFYNVMLTESGISSARCVDTLIYRSPQIQLGEGHGLELSLRLAGREYSLLPEPSLSGKFIWELGENICYTQISLPAFDAKCSTVVAGPENGELRFAEIRAKENLGNCQLCLSFEPVLANYNDYVNHPAFWRLGIEARVDGNVLILHRLPRSGNDELWLCVSSDSNLSFKAERTGGSAFLSQPEVTLIADLSLSAGESVSLRFALCLADNLTEAYAGVQRMLTFGPSQFGAMAYAAAVHMALSSRDISAAMGMLRPLRFPAVFPQPATKKQDLWKYGISGDLPIICRSTENQTRANIMSTVKQFCLLRSCGIKAELIFLADEGGDYFRPVYSAVRDTLAQFGLESLLSSAGGIFILPLSASGEAYGASSLILGSGAEPRVTGRKYHVSKQVGRSIESVPEFAYDKDNCFVFYVNRNLPTKVWSNMLTNGHFGFLAADSGCGNMWLENAREMRLSPWNNDASSVSGPETLEYVSENGRYSLFASNGANPCRIKFGFGFAQWETEIENAGVRCTAFVPLDCNARVFIIEVKGSLRGEIVWKTDLLLSDQIENRQAVDVSYVNRILKAASPRSYIDGCEFKAAFSSLPIGWTGDYFSWYRGEMDEKCGEGTLPIMAAAFAVSPSLIIVCGACDDSKLIELCKLDYALQKLEETKIYWRNMCMKLSCKAPVAAMGHYLSGWSVYQTVACRLMGRCSMYQSGGAIGFRDQLQDAVNMLLISPTLAREQILAACRHQYVEGDVMHWWHPDSNGDKGVRTRCSDDLLWLVWALCEYTEKTGDLNLCSKSVCYVNSPPLSSDESDRYETPAVTDFVEDVLSHAKKAMNLCFDRGTGSHGLLYFGANDWNDGMDGVGGESVWLSWFYAHTAHRFADLLKQLCDDDSFEVKSRATMLSQAADSAWDGGWYLRGYWPDGEKLGSHENKCCRIDSISQSWAAFTPGASNSRVDMALDSAVELLYDRDNKIVKLFDPPFSGDCRDPGYIKSYGPGFRENGGQYTHGAIWLAMACIRRGKAETGYGILRDLLPENHDIRRYLAEPFVIPADVYSGTEHLGEAGWTWYTGSAGWYFRVLYEELFGLKMWAGSLYIRPALPENFGSVQILWTDSRGKRHEILLSGTETEFDGEKYDGKGIPI